MLTVSKNKRAQPLFLSEEITGAPDIIFVGSVSSIVDNVLRVTIPEISVVGPSGLSYQIVPDPEIDVVSQIVVDPPADKGE